MAIQFAAVAGSKSVACGKPIVGLGTTSTTAQLTDLRHPPAGLAWSYSKGDDAVTLIDLENGTAGCAAEETRAMNSVVGGTAPKGSYVGVRYSISVPESLSHTDLTAVPAPLNNLAMGWPWQFGRKYMKIEVSEDGGPAWESKTFFVHIGATGCKGNPAAGGDVHCALPNRDEVTLAKFDPSKQKIAVDLKALLAGVDVRGEAGSAMPMADGMEGMPTGGCMSDPGSPDCKPIFAVRSHLRRTAIARTGPYMHDGSVTTLTEPDFSKVPRFANPFKSGPSSPQATQSQTRSTVSSR